VKVKVLDIDRDRQRISLGLKQTQEDPWQRIVDTYNVGDELAGKVTKVVTFGAFVEILDGVEGLVHISELAGRHVESPREIVHPGDEIRVKILEIDTERRRLSLSAKRVEDQILPVARSPKDEAAQEPSQVEPTAEVAQGEPTAEEPIQEEPIQEEPTAEPAAETQVSSPEASAAEPPTAEPAVAEPAASEPAAEPYTETQTPASEPQDATPAAPAEPAQEEIPAQEASAQAP
jgi:small subunit ribosomal protein S1